jgi:hypothetical protein
MQRLCVDQRIIEAHFIVVFNNNLRSGIHRHKFLKNVISIVEDEELHDYWKESIIVPVYKKGDRTDCSNYRRILLLSASYKVFSNILPSRLSPYID